jgi:IS605 OrfB family transposase
VKKPLILEILDFRKKKARLVASHGAKYAQMLSNLAYSQIWMAINSRAKKDGVQVYQVDPAYTSLIGRLKFRKLLSNHIHLAAAFVIARRHFQFSEILPKILSCYQLLVRGQLVTLVKPEDLAKPDSALLRVSSRRLKQAFSTGNQKPQKTTVSRKSVGRSERMMGRTSLVSSRLKPNPEVAFPPTGMVTKKEAQKATLVKGDI